MDPLALYLEAEHNERALANLRALCERLRLERDALRAENEALRKAWAVPEGDDNAPALGGHRAVPPPPMPEGIAGVRGAGPIYTAQGALPNGGGGSGGVVTVNDLNAAERRVRAAVTSGTMTMAEARQVYTIAGPLDEEDEAARAAQMAIAHVARQRKVVAGIVRGVIHEYAAAVLDRLGWVPAVYWRHIADL
jgi:hypothetical protein